MRCAPFIFAVLVVGCKDSARERELAGLRAKVAALEGKSSLSAAGKPAPALVPTALPPLPSSEATTTAGELSSLGPLLSQARATQGNKRELGRMMIEAVENSKIIKYEHIIKNPAKYVGTPWKTSGYIMQITESKTRTFGRLALRESGEQQLFFVEPNQTEFLTGDNVDIVGYLAGSFTYTSQANWTINIPSLVALAIFHRGQVTEILRQVKVRHK